MEEQNGITHRRLKVLMKRCYEIKRPLLVKGTIGIGKSMTILNLSKEIAKEEKREFAEWVKADRNMKKEMALNPQKYCIFVDERIALKDATDDKGVPLLDGNLINVGNFQVRYLEWVKTLILNIASHPDSMVIFFKDEINLAPPSIQSSQYQMILDKGIDELSFGKNTFIIAAGNRQEDNSNVFEMSWALKNRFCHATLLPPNLPDWTEDFALPNKVDFRLVSFLQFMEKYLFRLPEMENMDDAFPTPRTIVFASELIKDVQDLELIREYVESAVGKAFAKEFVAWLRLTQTIDLKDILENPHKVAEIMRMDIQTSVISGIADIYRRDNSVLLKAVDVAMNIPREEFSTYMLRLLKSINQAKFMIEISKSKYFIKISEKFSKYMDKNNN